ncbi:MAG: pyridoxal-phosphate dependent enzyme [Bacteroidales bacterium]|nr:pyridoxal-phosphate dependent enzyme [Bacteroidales bacterium]
MENKYKLVCTKCGKIIPDFATWFEMNQECTCGCKRADVVYSADYHKITELTKPEHKPTNFYHYFDFLPVMDEKNIVTYNEGAIPIEEWDFLEKLAKEKYGIDCKVMVYRNDLNGGTNTFKDIAASLAATIFKENGVKEYCVASTGNTATAYARYLAKAGIKFTVFMPNDTYQDTVDAIRATGQNVIVCKGNYGDAKKEAADFHKENHVLISAGNIDPIRVEAKKTMVFEYLRQLGKMPDVYVQAVAGGTGPIALDKGIREMQATFPETKMPRMLLIQQDTCDPMVQGWNKAVKAGFPEGYEKDYPIIENPKTMVSILSAGNPGMYPIVAPIVRKSGGTFLQVKEDELSKYGKIVKKERNLYLGPASIVCFAGFYKALEDGQIHNGETVLLNTGEGAARASRFVKMIDEA